MTLDHRRSTSTGACVQACGTDVRMHLRSASRHHRRLAVVGVLTTGASGSPSDVVPSCASGGGADIDPRTRCPLGRAPPIGRPAPACRDRRRAYRRRAHRRPPASLALPTNIAVIIDDVRKPLPPSPEADDAGVGIGRAVEVAAQPGDADERFADRRRLSRYVTALVERSVKQLPFDRFENLLARGRRVVLVQGKRSTVPMLPTTGETTIV